MEIIYFLYAVLLSIFLVSQYLFCMFQSMLFDNNDFKEIDYIF